jgi:hypothetical protein
LESRTQKPQIIFVVFVFCFALFVVLFGSVNSRAEYFWVQTLNRDFNLRRGKRKGKWVFTPLKGVGWAADGARTRDIQSHNLALYQAELQPPQIYQVVNSGKYPLQTK